MLLRELYQEESNSSVTHNGQRYNLNKLFTIIDKFQTRTFKVEDLVWVLKYSKPDAKRVHEADLSTPIVVTYFDKKLVVIDGLHRLCKAVEQGVVELEGKFVYKDVLDKCKITKQA
jgi:hypothetical protein